MLNMNMQKYYCLKKKFNASPFPFSQVLPQWAQRPSDPRASGVRRRLGRLLTRSSLTFASGACLPSLVIQNSLPGDSDSDARRTPLDARRTPVGRRRTPIGRP